MSVAHTAELVKPVLPCPDCRYRGRGGMARIGSNAGGCSTCNRWWQTVYRLTRRRLQERFPDEYERLRLRVEADLYPAIMEEWLEEHPDPADTDPADSPNLSGTSERPESALRAPGATRRDRATAEHIEALLRAAGGRWWESTAQPFPESVLPEPPESPSDYASLNALRDRPESDPSHPPPERPPVARPYAPPTGPSERPPERAPERPPQSHPARRPDDGRTQPRPRAQREGPAPQPRPSAAVWVPRSEAATGRAYPTRYRGRV